MKRQHIIGVSSAKTEKGEALGYLTGICYLSPEMTAEIPDFNACPWAGNCKAVCLNTAGRGAFSSVQKGRRRKTVLWATDKEEFLRNAALDITAVVRKAKREGMIPCIRMDGTSDIGIALTRAQDGERLVDKFPDVQFYDYTKSVTRMIKYLTGTLPKNYHLTFSHDGVSNYNECRTVLSMGGNVAVVFRKKIPTEWALTQVIDGDASDLRFLDPKGGYIVGLKAKGKAKKDFSGFVVDTI